MGNLVIYNGKVFSENEPLITATNRGFRYGDGLFETMRFETGQILFGAFHFQRLFHGLHVLQFELPQHFTPKYLQQQVLDLCERNQTLHAARVRLVVFRGDGGLFDPANLQPNFVIQTTPLESPNQRLNENGLVVDVYGDVAKALDTFSSLKSNNFLPYVMAALYARKQRLNETLVLNQHQRICDCTTANVFWVSEGEVFTPPLDEAPVAGTVRRFLLENSVAGLRVHEMALTAATLTSASEVFVTNAIHGIRWVGQFRDTRYSNRVGQRLFDHYLKNRFAFSTLS